jgi:hypothetical protein
MKIFLDDVRIPKECINYMYHRIGPLNPIYLEEWVVIKNYYDFVKIVKQNHKDITHVSFDHDLGEDVALEAIDKGMSKRQARKKLKKNVQSGYEKIYL